MVTMVEVIDGSCGMKTSIIISKISSDQLHLDIQSTCKHIKKLVKAINSRLNMIEATKPFGQNIIYAKAIETMPGCIPCVVPCAIIKALWAELGLTMPKNAKIFFADNSSKETSP